MRRGDIVTAALPGDYGKPRPAVVVQSDALAKSDSILICPFTTDLQDATLVRIEVEPSGASGLKRRSQIMVDKVTVVRRTRCGPRIGALATGTLEALNERLAFVLGLADSEPTP